MMSGVTWYDVLGVLPDAVPEDIRAAWQVRKAALQPGTLAGAPPDVLPAADRARQVVEEAWGVLADPAARASYDEEIGFVRPGRAWHRPGGGRRGLMSAWVRGGPRRMRNRWSRIRIRIPGWWCRMSRGCSTARAWRWPAGSACT